MEKFRKVTQSFTKFQFKYVSNRNFIKLYQRYRIFFPRKSSFLCTLTGKSNKWMKMLFSFPAPEKKKQFWNRMNEWPTNFSASKKKNRKFAGNFLETHKKSTCFFFRVSRKKNTIFGFAWLNGQRSCPRKKIRYLWLYLSLMFVKIAMKLNFS